MLLNGMYDIGDGPALPILVDDFRHENGVSSYFLTHLHADHTRGLCKNWNNGIIFCSEVTLRLFNHKFKELCVSSRLLRALELGVPHDVLLSNCMPATITLVDANHCPGAVMVVIEVQGRCVVHTGDCRWQASMARHPCLWGKKVHTAFLDCTYAKPQFTFPSREEAAAQVVSLSRRYQEHIIYIAVDTLGKEELLVALAQALDERVFVSLDRFLRMSLCGFNMGLFTTKADAARIRTMDRRQLTAAFIQSRQQAQPCVGIVPTGWSLEHKEQRSSCGVQSHFYTVPYSLHSSFDELVDFVRSIKPKQIVPTSDAEGGGLESCSALCHRALGAQNLVRVTALHNILRSNETASSLLCKRNASGMYAPNRKATVGVGALADSPSPIRAPAPAPQPPLPVGVEDSQVTSVVPDTELIGPQASPLPQLHLDAETASPRWIPCKRR
jgi:DNA cross-link repair 1B protein